MYHPIHHLFHASKPILAYLCNSNSTLICHQRIMPVSVSSRLLLTLYRHIADYGKSKILEETLAIDEKDEQCTNAQSVSVHIADCE